MIWRVSRMFLRAGQDGTAVVVLPIVAFGVVTTLLLTVLGGAQSFWTWSDADGPLYQLLASIALVLLVVPLVSLGGAAARLSARRRDDRLSTLRLLGASASTVTGLAVLESVALAAAGTVAGIVGYLALAPAVGLISFRGEPLGFAAVLLPVPAVIGLAVGLIALAAVSALVALRRVVISPLGVRTRQDAPRIAGARALIGFATIGGICVALFALSRGELGGVVLAVIAIAMYAVTLLVLNLLGPWVIRRIALGQARRAATPAKLLSARSVLDDPKGAWRQVSGVAMTSFMAVFAGTGMGVAASGGDPLLVDIRTGVIITVIGSFIAVACAVGVSQAADVYDRREITRSLVMLGMPVATVDAARRRAIMSPLRIVTIGSALCAVAMVLPLITMTMLTDPTAVVSTVAILVIGIGVVSCALLSTRPLLRSTARLA